MSRNGEAPHFVSDYQRMVRRLLSGGLDRDEAMSKAVGGNYERGGDRERDLLVQLGLSDEQYLIDAGCGSGRLSSALSRGGPDVRYLGTDVVPDLLAYAKDRAAKPDWRFELVDGLAIPERDGVADMVCFFSVLTHLTENEGDAYLIEAKRVLKVGGQIVASFLDPAGFSSWFRFKIAASQALHRVFRHRHLSAFTTQAVMERRANLLGMSATFIGDDVVGQHVCVFS
jgi:ubiquinone/menaquinone biosynthesis C-methylase UbiE